MKRMARRAIEAAVPILGITVILSSVLLSPQINVQLHVTVLLVGVLILLTGPPWKLSRMVLPNERVALALREEAERFLELLRELKRTADKRDGGQEDGGGEDAGQEDAGREEDGQELGELFGETVEKMHTSVDRMAELIG